MRVAMKQVVDVSKDFSMRNLSIAQKFSVISGVASKDSKILAKRKKMEEERALRVESDKIEQIKDGLLANIQYHLRDNLTLGKFNQKAKIVEWVIDRENEERVKEELKSSEFNVYGREFIPLDSDLVNSFGDAVPVLLRIWSLEVTL